MNSFAKWRTPLLLMAGAWLLPIGLATGILLSATHKPFESLGSVAAAIWAPILVWVPFAIVALAMLVKTIASREGPYTPAIAGVIGVGSAAIGAPVLVIMIASALLLPPPEDRPPTVVHSTPAGDPDNEGCIAQGPEKGLLDQTSRAYTRIEVLKGKQTVKEIATLRSGNRTITVERGGCAHFGEWYQFSLVDDHDLKDKGHYVDRALAVLSELEYANAQESNRDQIQKATANPREQEELETCSFWITEGYDRVYCSFSRPNPESSTVDVMIGYDIAL